MTVSEGLQRGVFANKWSVWIRQLFYLATEQDRSLRWLQNRVITMYSIPLTHIYAGSDHFANHTICSHGSLGFRLYAIIPKESILTTSFLFHPIGFSFLFGTLLEYPFTSSQGTFYTRPCYATWVCSVSSLTNHNCHLVFSYNCNYFNITLWQPCSSPASPHTFFSVKALMLTTSCILPCLPSIYLHILLFLGYHIHPYKT